MHCNLSAPTQRLFRREAGTFEPAPMEECSGAVRSSRPYQPRNAVNSRRMSPAFSGCAELCPADTIGELYSVYGFAVPVDASNFFACSHC